MVWYCMKRSGVYHVVEELQHNCHAGVSALVDILSVCGCVGIREQLSNLPDREMGSGHCDGTCNAPIELPPLSLILTVLIVASIYPLSVLPQTAL